MTNLFKRQSGGSASQTLRVQGTQWSAVVYFPGSLSARRSPSISVTWELRLFLCINEKSRTSSFH